MRSKPARVRKGFGLVEAMMAIFVLSLLCLSIAYMYQYLAVVSVKTLENAYSTRLSEMTFSKLKTMEYYYLFDSDSSLANFGLGGTFGPVTLQRTPYPYAGLLNNIDATIKKYRIERWSLAIKYKLRDVSDVNGNGLTGDLRDFADSDANNTDDYDPSVRYYAANADSDYYDTYVSTSLNKTVSEAPDTNLKEVTLRFYKRGRVIHTQQELISLEMLSGIESKASGAELKLFVTQPANDTYLYNLMSAPRAAAFSQGITKTYPPEVTAYRADTGSPLRLWGETVPLATVRFYVNSLGTVLDTRSADSAGNFDFQSPGVTAALVEGGNTVYAQATKDTYYSPYAPRDVVLDLNPPAISSQSPAGIVADLMPYVGAVLTDAILSTGIAGGICDEVTNLKVNGSAANFAYNAATGEIKWLDPAANLPARLVNGNSYTVTAEGGDRAYYKVVSTWTFTVSVSATDNSAPSMANKVPSGFTSEPMPEISSRIFDNQSGIDVYSIAMKLDGTVVVSSANIADCWDARNQRVFYRPAAPFASPSSHAIEVSASHWADDPPDKKTSVETWSFNVNY